MVVPFRLIWRNMFASPLVGLRTILTVLSLAVAIFLLCFLRTVVVSLNAGVEASASNRLIVQSAVSLFVSLPLSYQGKIEGVQGVATVTKFQWFGGFYQDPANFFAQFAVDPDKFYECYPEVELVQGQREAFLSDRTACLIGTELARKYGWKPGDKVPLVGTIFPRVDGTSWEFQVVGVYHSKSANVDNNTLFFPYKYLDESLDSGQAAGPHGSGVYTIKLAPGARPETVMAAVDRLFENGPQRVQATTEAEFQRQFVTMIGSVPTFIAGIGSAVLFAIVLAVVNTMLMAGRERTQDLGILKALGFDDRVAFLLLMLESLLLCAMGGGLGVQIAIGSEHAFAKMLSLFVPSFVVTDETIGLAFGLAVAIGVVAGAVPAWRAAQLKVVEALRAEA